MFDYDFMRNALYAILIITPIFGLIGTLIVNNKMRREFRKELIMFYWVKVIRKIVRYFFFF